MPRVDVTGIEDVIITAKEGQMMLPLPEGASYLGFHFCPRRHARAGRRRLAVQRTRACVFK